MSQFERLHGQDGTGGSENGRRGLSASGRLKIVAVVAVSLLAVGVAAAYGALNTHGTATAKFTFLSTSAPVTVAIGETANITVVNWGKTTQRFALTIAGTSGKSLASAQVVVKPGQTATLPYIPSKSTTVYGRMRMSGAAGLQCNAKLALVVLDAGTPLVALDNWDEKEFKS